MFILQLMELLMELDVLAFAGTLSWSTRLREQYHVITLTIVKPTAQPPGSHQLLRKHGGEYSEYYVALVKSNV